MVAISIKYLKILLLEDSHKDAQIIIESLGELGIKDVALAKTYRQAVQLFDSQSFDLIISDIFLGKNNRRGDDFIRYIRRKKFMTPVIYLTSFYEPKTYEEVKKTLPKCFLRKDISLLSLRQAIELSLMQDQAIGSSPLQVKPDTFFVKIGDNYRGIKLDEVSYFYTHEKTTYIQFKERNYPIHNSLKSLEEMLFHRGFVRAHRGYLVNLNLASSISISNDSISINETKIPIGYNYRKHLLSRMNIVK